MTGVMDDTGGPAAPDKVGKYRILGLLGQGAMGRVYLGEDPHIGRKVAVKVLSGATGDEARSRFLEEARTIGRLSHPEIVTLLEFGFHEGQPFLAMEYLEGESFDHWLAGPVTEHRVLEVLQALCRAVEHAHDHGVLHRDVKPSNLQVLDDGRAKLLDFGIARSGSVSLTATGMLLGTPQFLAPEVLEGKGHSRASDVYAVGLVAYQALGGSNPFAADTLEQCLKRVLTEPPEPLEVLRPDLPTTLTDAVMACIAKAPEGRPSGVGPLRTALAETLTRRPEHAVEALDGPTVRLERAGVVGTREESPAPHPGGRPGVRLAAGAAALAAVALGGWLLFAPGPGPRDPADPDVPSAGEPQTEHAALRKAGPDPADGIIGPDRAHDGATESDARPGGAVPPPGQPKPGAESGPQTPRRTGTSTSPEDPKSSDDSEGDTPRGPALEGQIDRSDGVEATRNADTAAPGARPETETASPRSSEIGNTAAGPSGSDASAGTTDHPAGPRATMEQTTARPPETVRGTPDHRGPPTGSEAGNETPSGSLDRSDGSPAERGAEGAETEKPRSEPETRVRQEATTPIAGPEDAGGAAPALERLRPAVVRRGMPITLALDGSSLDEDTQIQIRRGSSRAPGIEVRRVRANGDGGLRVTLYVAPDAPLGLYSVVAIDATGHQSNSLGLEVSL